MVSEFLSEDAHTLNSILMHMYTLVLHSTFPVVIHIC